MSTATLFDSTYGQRKKELLAELVDHLRPEYSPEELSALRVDPVIELLEGDLVRRVFHRHARVVAAPGLLRESFEVAQSLPQRRLVGQWTMPWPDHRIA